MHYLVVVGSHAVVEGRDGLRVSGQSLPHLGRGPGQGSLLPLGPPLLTLQEVFLQMNTQSECPVMKLATAQIVKLQ